MQNIFTGKEWSKKKKGKGKSKVTKDQGTAKELTTASDEGGKEEKSTDMETLQALLAAKKQELQSKLSENRSENEKINGTVVLNGMTRSNFLAHLVYQPKSLYKHALSVVSLAVVVCVQSF